MYPQNFPCTNCGTAESKGQWWSLKGYYKITGRFCPACYDKVSHDSYGNPNNPKDYSTILAKQKGY